MAFYFDPFRLVEEGAGFLLAAEVFSLDMPKN